MSTGQQFLETAERVSDWLNPILVKETRQSLKSRQFVVTFMLLLFAAWLISVGGVMLMGSAIEYGSAGQGFFGLYFAVLVFAILVIVPFGAFRSMLAERDQFTFELLSISTLSPRQIVWGKLCSAIVQILLFYSAIAPFIAFTSLLQGFDFANVVFLLTAAFLWAVFVSMFALMLSTISHKRQWQSTNSIGMVILLIWQIGAVIGVSSRVMMDALPFGDPEFWWVLSCFLLGGGSYFLLAQQIAVSRLTFESDNRSTGIRVICGIQFWGFWAGCAIYLFWYGWTGNDGLLAVASALSLIHWTVIGLFAVTEEDYLSRRVRRRVPKRFVLRLLYSFWLPGGGRAMAWVVLHLALVAAVVISISASGKWTALNADDVSALLFGAGYCVIFLGAACAFARWGRVFSPDFRAAHARVATIILFALAMVAPYLPVGLGLVRETFGYSLRHVSNPFAVLSSTHIMSESDRQWTIAIIGLGTVISLLVNLPAMLRGVAEIVKYHPSERASVPAVAAVLSGPSAFEAHEPPPHSEALESV